MDYKISKFDVVNSNNVVDILNKVRPKELSENGAVLAVLSYGLANLEKPLPR